MSDLFNAIQADLKQAMKDRDSLKVSTLRMLTAAVKQFQIDQQKDADDATIIGIITKMIKQRQDSAKAFTEGNRPELAEKEEKEAEILQPYLPEQMNDAEVEAAITEAIAQTDAAAMGDMGKVMGVLTPKLKGRADMGMVSGIVRNKLNS
jgi:uncharacterized protein YqeY